MPLEDDIQAIINRIPDTLPLLGTEEATKNALIMPFIAALGYNVFSPTEVVPEFTADVGNRVGEKVDYAILHDGKPIILVECKAAGTVLNEQHTSQLVRYFSTTDVRIGILTNGVIYRFYSDLDQPNRMDARPFLEIDLANADATTLPELQRFAKDAFDLKDALEAASELKYTREIRLFLAQQLRAPEEDFVSFLTSKIYAGRRSTAAINRFTPITKTAFTQFLNDQVQSRLQAAARIGDISVELATDIMQDEDDAPPEDSIVTTREELEAFYIVKTILSDLVLGQVRN